jgi:arylsulfatase A-like enzyme
LTLSNISAYHRGMMGGRTPNIDRIAKEGALFTQQFSFWSLLFFKGLRSDH